MIIISIKNIKSYSNHRSSFAFLTPLTKCLVTAEILSSTATPLTKKVRREHYLFTCYTRSKQIVWFQKRLRSVLRWSSAFDICKNDANRAIFDVDYTTWNESFLKLFRKLNFWCFSTSERYRRVHKAAKSLTLLFFDSHFTSSKSFKLRLISSKSVKLRFVIMTSQSRRQLKLTPVAAAVAAIDKRRRQRQQVNNQCSRVIRKKRIY